MRCDELLGSLTQSDQSKSAKSTRSKSSKNPPAFALPPFMRPIPSTDSRFSALNSTGFRFALKPPGFGGVSAFMVAEFTEMHDVYRLSGGPASEFGFWWSLATDSNTVLPVTKKEYMSKYFAICNEFNDGTRLTRCTVPAGTSTVVGPGQTKNCENDEMLYPERTPLQLNRDIVNQEGVTCVSCVARDNLSDSSCAVSA